MSDTIVDSHLEQTVEIDCIVKGNLKNTPGTRGGPSGRDLTLAENQLL